jgi:uncharacterized cofD-like protein
VNFKMEIECKKPIKEKLNPKIVALGGGTGLSNLLRGLKLYTNNITAIVTVADDGGNSGQIREDLGILPPGDIRNCILALADMEPAMEQLLQYRFKEGYLKGQNLGNLLIAAMTDISGGFEKAVDELGNVLAITGRVLPVTIDNMTLKALLKNGEIVYGESNIPKACMNMNTHIERIFISPEDCKSLPEVVEAIYDADAIVLGPGSLYTSIMPNLLVHDVYEAILRNKCKKIYVCNVMTQPGETVGYGVLDHVKAITDHCGYNILEYVLANDSYIPNDLLEKYEEEGSSPVRPCESAVNILEEIGIRLVTADIMDITKGFIRHDPVKLAQEVMNIILQPSDI